MTTAFNSMLDVLLNAIAEAESNCPYTKEDIKNHAKQQQQFMLKERNGFVKNIEELQDALHKVHIHYKMGTLAYSIDRYKKARINGLKLLINQKKCLEVIEDSIRFYVSIRKKDKKNTIKYHQKCMDSESKLLDLLMEGNATLGEAFTIGCRDKHKSYNGDDEICRQFGKSMLKNEKTRKNCLQICDDINYWS